MLDIVIVNWNAGAYLTNCIYSVISNSNGLVNKIIIVDNASTDHSAQSVEGLDKVQLIYANDNLGFGKACNLGAASCSSEFILFLNPDAGIYADTLEKTIAFMQHPDQQQVAICGVQLINEASTVTPSCSRFPSVVGFLSHALALDKVFPQLGNLMADWDHASTRKVDQIIGAFLFMRRKVFVELDGFDENFFVYFEEVDLSLRTARAGWHSVYYAGAQAFHAGGGTSNKVKARRLFYSTRSRLIYSFKNFSPLGAVCVAAITLAIEPFSRTTLGILRWSPSSVCETWAGYVMLWQWLPQWVLKGQTR